MEEQCKQDAKAVGAITKAVLKLHKENNPDIKEYWLRSDQAGEYWKANLLCVITKISSQAAISPVSFLYHYGH